MCLRSLCFTLAALIATIARADRPNAPATPPPPAPIIFDATLVGDTIVAVGSDGTVLHHRNDQPTWEVVASGTEANLCGVSFADARYGWIVGHGGTILRSADGGLTWQSRGPRRSHHLGFLDVLALAPNHVIVIGGNGVYRETRDGGETWLPREVIEERVHLNRITRAPSGTLFIVGDSGLLLRSSNAGGDWKRLPLGHDDALYGVLALASDRLLVYGAGGRVYRSADDGTSWEAVTVPSDFITLSGAQAPDGAILLTGPTGRLFVSRDDAETFELREVPITGTMHLLMLSGTGLLGFGDYGVAQLAVP